MFRNQYDSDVTVWSPQGRIHQIEYAMKAVTEGSATVGVRSNTHAVLAALKRSPNELSGYQKKIYMLDQHVGISMAGLLCDGRLLARFLHNECVKWQWTYQEPIHISKLLSELEKKMQINTQRYGRRPFGVGLLVAGADQSGAYIFQTCPSGMVYDCLAMSIGGRSQSARTYLNRHVDDLENCTLDQLIQHALIALRETLPTDINLTVKNTTLAIVGSGTPFTVYEEDAVSTFLQQIASVPTMRQQGEDEPLEEDTTSSGGPSGAEQPPPPPAAAPPPPPPSSQ